MHISLLNQVGNVGKPQHAIYQRAQQTAPVSSGSPATEPQDTVTLSPEAMNAMRVDHRSNHQFGHARAQENKINSLEKWVDKAVSKTERNGGDIPFGMEWKLEYITSRIDKALTTNIDIDGNAINLTGEQQEKLIQINDKINGLLNPVSTEENAAVIEEPEVETSALIPPTEESEIPTVSVIPAEVVEPADVPETTVALLDPGAVLDTAILDTLEEEQETTGEQTVSV